MATNVTLNGVSYSIPAVGDSAWGSSLSSFLVALPTGVLTKAGGSFPLTAAADFGANFGLKASSFASRGTAASAGIVRLANDEGVAWRNAANSADLTLKVNSSNVLEFGGNPVTTLALGTANHVLKMNSGGTAYEYGLLANSNIDASAAIAYSKLNLSNSILNADISSSASIAFSKLATLAAGSVLLGNGSNVATATALSGDVTVNSSGVTAISSGVIVDADVNASAAIARSKLAAGTASHVLINDGSGNFSSEATLAKSRGGTGADNSSVTFPSSGTIVTQAATETLSNKTLAIPYLTTGGDFEDLLSAPSNPSSGRVRLYFEGGALRYRDSGGTVTSIGAGIASLGGLTDNTQTFSSTDGSITFNSASGNHDIELADTISGARTFSDTFKIGSAATTGKFNVKSSGTSTVVGVFEASGTTNRLWYVDEDGSGNADMYLRDSSNSNQVRLNASGNSYLNGGNVGIGTTSPTNGVLHVFGDASGATSLATSASSATARLQGGAGLGNSTGLYFGAMGTVGDQYIQVSNGTGTAAWDLGLNPYGGSVGIGTTSPNVSGSGNTVLTVREETGNNGNARIEIVGNVDADNETAGLISYHNTNSGTDTLVELIARRHGSGGTNGGQFEIKTADTSNVMQSAIYVNENQNVGIGTTSPGKLLDINGGELGVTYSIDAKPGIGISNTNSGSGAAARITVTADGGTAVLVKNSTACTDTPGADRFGIFNETGGVYLNAGGTSWIAISDMREKTKVADLGNVLEGIQNLSVFTYTLNDSVNAGKAPVELGLSAQEVVEVLPEIVQGSEDTRYTISYDRLSVALVKAIQELSELRSEDATLLSQLVSLRSEDADRIAALEARIQTLEGGN